MFTTRPEITGTFGVASSTHWLASQTAMGVLECGGNAFDAAVAAGFVLQVVEPHLNGPGGEVPILLWDASQRRMHALRGQGPAPQEASVAAFRALGFEQVPGTGLLPAVVPAAFTTWLTMLRDHGSWDLADVLAPAIGYARDGFPVLPRLSQAILAVRELFARHWPSSADVWLPDGKVPMPGSLHTLPALAAVYERILQTAQREAGTRTGVIDAAIRCWQQGFVAREIDRYYRTEAVLDTSGERHTGLLRYEDMAAWRLETDAPLTADFGRYTVAKCGFWSQGPMFLQQLGVLRHADLAAHAPGTAGFVHLVSEAAKLALADRLAWYGTAQAPRRACSRPCCRTTTCGRAGLRSTRTGLRKTCARGGRWTSRPACPTSGSLPARSRRPRSGSASASPRSPRCPPPSEWADREIFVGDTCHVDVIDRHGNMVAATPSGGWLSSSPAVPALGFGISTRLQMTWMDEGLPNTLTPGVAPCTTLSPTIALRDGEPTWPSARPAATSRTSGRWRSSCAMPCTA
jgi:gamma-glutamyltranspeptidase/glutathione hydrolase